MRRGFKAEAGLGAPGWLKSVERPTLDTGSGHDLAVREIEPHVGLCLGFSLPHSLPLPYLLSLSLSLKINK